MRNVASLIELAEKLKCRLSAKESRAEHWLSRQQLQNCYRDILISDLALAVERKIEQDLWNLAFRQQISQLENPERGQRDAARTSLKLFLEMAAGFYMQLFQQLSTTFDVNIPIFRIRQHFGLDVDPRQNIERVPSKQDVNYILQYCLVHLGDICRYIYKTEERHSHAPVYLDEARNYYRSAIELVPHNGQPFNQLAILELQDHNKLGMVFLYCRSLAVKNPFNAAQQNLEKYLRKLCGDHTSLDARGRMQVPALITAFLQTHALVVLTDHLDRAETVLQAFSASAGNLFRPGALAWSRLIQCVAVNVYCQTWLARQPAKLRCCQKVLATFFDLLLHYLDKADGNIAESALLHPIYAICRHLEFNMESLLVEGGPFQIPRLWHNFCAVLAKLSAAIEKGGGMCESTTALSEDWELRQFAPMSATQADLEFNANKKLSPDLQIHVRLCRIIDCATAVAGIYPKLLVFTDGVFSCPMEVTEEEMKALAKPLPAPVLHVANKMNNTAKPAEKPAARPVVTQAKLGDTPTVSSATSTPAAPRRNLVFTTPHFPPKPAAVPQRMQEAVPASEAIVRPVLPNWGESRTDFQQKAVPQNRQHLPPRLRRLLEEQERTSKGPRAILKPESILSRDESSDQDAAEESEEMDAVSGGYDDESMGPSPHPPFFSANQQPPVNVAAAYQFYNQQIMAATYHQQQQQFQQQQQRYQQQSEQHYQSEPEEPVRAPPPPPPQFVRPTPSPVMRQPNPPPPQHALNAMRQMAMQRQQQQEHSMRFPPPRFAFAGGPGNVPRPPIVPGYGVPPRPPPSSFNGNFPALGEMSENRPPVSSASGAMMRLPSNGYAGQYQHPPNTAVQQSPSATTPSDSDELGHNELTSGILRMVLRDDEAEPRTNSAALGWQREQPQWPTNPFGAPGQPPPQWWTNPHSLGLS